MKHKNKQRKVNKVSHVMLVSACNQAAALCFDAANSYLTIG